MSEHDRPDRTRGVPVIDPRVFASLDVYRQVSALAEQVLAVQRREVAAALASITQWPAFEAMELYRQTFASLLAPMQELVGMHSTYMAQVAKSLSALGRVAMPDLRIAPFSASFLEYLRDLQPLQWRAARELASRGWWLVPTWSSNFLLGLMAEREQKKCRVGPLLVRRYRKQRCLELGRMVRSWSLPEFNAGRRKSLFADALKHYRRREFRAVILEIAPQVEGILKDFLLAERLATPAEIKQMSTVRLFTTYVRSEREPSIGGYATQLELLYSQFTWVAPAPGSRVRRHPQAHGREVPQKSEQEALRMWLMLETLHFHLLRVRRTRAAGAA